MKAKKKNNKNATINIKGSMIMLNLKSRRDMIYKMLQNQNS